MRKYYKYYFHIIDNELNDEYDFQGYFEDHMEADKFITENENAGNFVGLVAPFIEEVYMNPSDLPNL